MNNRTEYDENNIRYTAHNGGNNHYSDNNGNYYGNGANGGNSYGNGGNNGNYYENGANGGNYYGNGGNNGSYYGNGANSGNYYGMGGYYDQAYDNADIESKVITRSFIVMFVSLLITAFVATIVAVNENLFYGMINSYGLLIFIEFAVVIGASFAVRKKNAVIAGILYTIYTVINGMTFSFIFYVYDLGSVQEIFIMTALLFGVMAVVGATTKMDLSKIGGISIMLLLGALMVTFANLLFLHSTGLNLVLDYLIVAIFVGLTAYDTQKMKKMARNTVSSDVNTIAIFCGMELYLDFINLFIRLLAIFGKRRN